MQLLNKLYPSRGSTHKKKTLGRGRASGHGATSTRGGKGQTARSGSSKNPGFEGGQMPLLRRIPKRGFSNARFAKEYGIVNLSQLEERFESGAEINQAMLFENGLLRKKGLPVKILGDGKLSKKFTVKAQAFSKGALEKIKSCGGSSEIKPLESPGPATESVEKK